MAKAAADATAGTDEATTTETGSDSQRLAGAALQSALEKERKSRKELEAQIKRLTDEAEKARLAELSENEQLKAKLAAAEDERQKLAAAQAAAAKANLVRSSARDFADPEDAVALLTARGLLDAIESAAGAERIVKGLATGKPHLLRVSDAEKVNRPGVAQILSDGLGVETTPTEGQGKKPKHVIPVAELVAMTPEAQVALKQSNPDLYWRSVQALNETSETTHTVV